MKSPACHTRRRFILLFLYILLHILEDGLIIFLETKEQHNLVGRVNSSLCTSVWTFAPGSGPVKPYLCLSLSYLTFTHVGPLWTMWGGIGAMLRSFWVYVEPSIGPMLPSPVLSWRQPLPARGPQKSSEKGGEHVK